MRASSLRQRRDRAPRREMNSRLVGLSGGAWARQRARHHSNRAGLTTTSLPCSCRAKLSRGAVRAGASSTGDSGATSSNRGPRKGGRGRPGGAVRPRAVPGSAARPKCRRSIRGAIPGRVSQW